ncbi:MFS transporter [Alicyclobacillus sp. TC]|uniref:Fucose permease n=1 Tax=Alicyclobacillus tolerans TaxID=90970 RepID=A0A1M6KEK7_9BACL|nr:MULTISPECIES: MFS transporter [Alicyclobacillus]QRF22994.1 MFS transporter [Alicyclobacillus sp. TC]SHJ57342.1 Fucose permease [Alicyclobacillus montanus]
MSTLVYRLAFFLSLFGMFTFGAIDMTRGVAAPLMQSGWHLSYLQLGYLFTINSLGYLLGSFIAGWILDRFGISACSKAGALLSSMGLIGVLQSPNYELAMVSFAFVGTGTGVLEIGVNGIVPLISREPSDNSRRFNTLHGFYGVGCVIFPVLAAWLMHRSGNWQSGYWLTSALMVTLFLATLFFPYRKVAPSKESPVKNTLKVTKQHSPWRSPVFFGFATALTVYVMIESGLASWLPTYMVHVHRTTLHVGSLYLTGFYFLFTCGRLSGQFWVHRLGEYRSIYLAGSLLLLSLLVTVCFPSTTVLLMVAGAGCSVIFPTVVAIASHAFPRNVGTVLGILFTAAGIGSLAINTIIGFLATELGLQKAFWIFPLLVAFVLLSVLATHLLDNRRRTAIEMAIRDTADYPI